MFENAYGRTDGQTDGRRLDSHPISSPCEPSAQVKLIKISSFKSSENIQKKNFDNVLWSPWNIIGIF